MGGVGENQGDINYEGTNNTIIIFGGSSLKKSRHGETDKKNFREESTKGEQAHNKSRMI